MQLGIAGILLVLGGAPGGQAGDLDPAEPKSRIPSEVAASQDEAATSEPDALADSELDHLSGMSLEELLDVRVVSATQTALRTEEAPAIVTVITRQQMARWGYESVAEMLSYTAGFHVVDDHMVPNVGVRGVSGGLRSQSGLIKVMIDGVSVAFRSTAGNWLGPELIPLAMVDQIEIIRGPASAVYGADAFLGVINVITRKPHEIGGAELISTGGLVSDKLAGGFDFAFGARREDFEYSLAGRIQGENRSGVRLPESSPAPQLPSYSADTDRASGLTHLSLTSLLQATYHFSDAGAVSTRFYISMLDRGGEFADWTQLAHGVDEQGRFTENRLSMVHGFVHSSLDWQPLDTLTLDVDGSLFMGEPTRRDRVDVGSDVFYVRREIGFKGGGATAGATWRPWPAWTFSARAGFDLEEQQLPGNLQVLKISAAGYDAGQVRETSSRRQGKQWIANPGGQLQVIWTSFEDLLSVTGGFRYDYHTIYGSQPSARIGAVLLPVEGMHLKLLYGTAFKAPSTVLLYGLPTQSGDILGNPDLRPQRIHTVESQVGYRFSRILSANLTAAYSRLLDKAEFALRGNSRIARNVAISSGIALEAELEAGYEEWIDGFLNLAWHYLERDLGEEGYQALLVGKRNILYPDLVVSGGLSGRVPYIPLRLSVKALYVGPRISSDTNSIERGEQYSLSGYVLLGAGVATTGLEIIKGKATRIAVELDNLFDATGPEPGFGGADYPLRPRTAFLRLSQEI